MARPAPLKRASQHLLPEVTLLPAENAALVALTAVLENMGGGSGEFCRCTRSLPTSTRGRGLVVHTPLSHAAALYTLPDPSLWTRWRQQMDLVVTDDGFSSFARVDAHTSSGACVTHPNDGCVRDPTAVTVATTSPAPCPRQAAIDLISIGSVSHGNTPCAW